MWHLWGPEEGVRAPEVIDCGEAPDLGPLMLYQLQEAYTTLYSSPCFQICIGMLEGCLGADGWILTPVDPSEVKVESYKDPARGKRPQASQAWSGPCAE